MKGFRTYLIAVFAVAVSGMLIFAGAGKLSASGSAERISTKEVPKEYYEDPTPAQALAGVKGYGADGISIQDPGAQAGAYVYAGTSVPYEAPDLAVAVPDSLETVFVNYIGRHGARYISSDKYTRELREYLAGCGALTPVGKRAARLCGTVDSVMSSQWGALDALGRDELAGIGTRMARRYGDLLKKNDSVAAFSSFVPRCVMSMDELTHAMVWARHGVELTAGSGHRYDALLRPFTIDKAYLEYKESHSWRDVYDGFCDTVCPAMPALRLSVGGSRLIERLCSDLLRRGADNSGAALEVALRDTLSGDWPEDWTRISGLTKEKATGLSQTLYKIVSGCAAVSFGPDPEIDYSLCAWQSYFTTAEYGSLWECGNLRHYLLYSASQLGDVPARMAVPLLRNLLATLDAAASGDYSGPGVIVRIGHAETMMPLLSLMEIPGCRYVGRSWGDVADNWMDFEVAPMGVNLQLALCRSKQTRRMYLITFLNEEPVSAPEQWEAASRRLQKIIRE